MQAFVVDASATLPWALKDEETAWTLGLLRQLERGTRIVVPAHWPTEVSNGLLVAHRRGRISLAHAQAFWDQLGWLPVALEPPLTAAQAKGILDLCEQHKLTFYDAAYLELAARLGLPLATLDRALSAAAQASSVAVLRETDVSYR